MKSNNRNLIIFLIALLSLIAVLLLGILIFLVCSNGDFSAFHPKSSVSAFDESYDSKEINTISIDSDYGNIEFFESDDENIRVVIGKTKVDNVTVHNENGNLEVKHKGNKISDLSFFQRNNINCDIEIYLPKKDFENITVKSSYGNVDADEITIKQLNVDLDFGNVEIESFTGAMDVKTDCGNIEFSNVKLTDSSILNSDMGNIEIENIRNVNINGKVSMGECKINNNDSTSSVSLIAQTDMGDIDIN